jgi:hypothetical protein
MLSESVEGAAVHADPLEGDGSTMSTVNWISAQGGDWSTGTNWEGGSVPASTDSAEIAVPGVYTVTITSNVSAANLTINATGETLDESGAGSLTLSDGLSLYNGAVFLNGSNSIGSSVEVVGGLLAVGNGGALGNGAVLLYGGELLATTTQTMTASMVLNAIPTIAAATGQTLTLKGGEQLRGPATLTFGASGEDGTILWEPTSFQLAGASPYNLDIRAGELVFGNFDEGFAALSSAWNSVDIEAGATLDLAGVPSSFSNLAGGGTLTGSSTSSVTIGGGQFTGNLTGYLNLNITGQVALAGSSTIGSIQIGNGAALTSLTNDPGGLIDLDTASDISLSSGASSAYFVNDGTVLRNDRAGSSVVSVPFLNFGTMRITTGSVTFTDGFTNAGTVEGRLTTNNNGTITWTPDPAANDFNGDTLSDILWQNSNGQAAIWEMNGTTPIDQQPVGANPGPSWTAIGTGDFNDDGHSDILWQNSSGQAAIWEMNGTTPIDQQAVGNPGPDWKAIGTGDFNDDGHSDILWQNSSGQVAIWEMNGTTSIDQQAVGANPGSDWKAIGTGDFSGDGYNDGILFQNTDGQVAIWEMNGTTPIDQQAVGANPGSDWKAIGTGDFNGDGFSDILFQNANGQALVWEMNGTNVIGGGAVSANPGAGWRALG